MGLIRRYQIWRMYRRWCKRYGKERIDQWLLDIAETGRKMFATMPTCAEAAAALTKVGAMLHESEAGMMIRAYCDALDKENCDADAH